jgi:ATP-dependent RNA helicase RhlE
MPFTRLGLTADLLRNVRSLGFAQPTPIQEQAIPAALTGRDVLACAMTGSGKTAAFVLPILQQLAERPRGATRALVVTPTRELAAQIEADFRALGRGLPLSVAAIFGGVGMGPQERALRRRVDVIVATPGRLLDHMRFQYTDLRQVELLVLDEADRMLDMGFLPDVRRILGRLPARRQTLFFSATLPTPIMSLAQELLREPAKFNIERQAAPAVGITQSAFPVAATLKSALLLELLKSGRIRSAIAFTRTKQRANRLAEYLVRNGIGAGRIHGNRSQAQRTQTLASFKAGRFPVLVATDLAARGIHVDALSHVINFDVPHTPEDYVHRVGRTARAEATGDAFLFVSPEEEAQVRGIERALGQRLPRVTVPGFDYSGRSVEKQAAPHAARGPRGPRRPPTGAGSARPRGRGRGPRGRSVIASAY